MPRQNLRAPRLRATWRFSKPPIEDISDQHSQADILNTLVNRAASFAPRIAFFVIKNEQAMGWRARGLEGTVGDDAVREIVLPLSADTPLSDVVRSRTTWSGSPGGNAEDYLLLNKLGSDPPQRMVAIPLIARGKAVAVLYADSAALDSDAINLEALETLVRVAGMAVELSRRASSAQPRNRRATLNRAAPASKIDRMPTESAAEEPQTRRSAARGELQQASETETPTMVAESARRRSCRQ